MDRYETMISMGHINCVLICKVVDEPRNSGVDTEYTGIGWLLPEVNVPKKSLAKLTDLEWWIITEPILEFTCTYTADGDTDGAGKALQMVIAKAFEATADCHITKISAPIKVDSPHGMRFKHTSLIKGSEVIASWGINGNHILVKTDRNYVYRLDGLVCGYDSVISMYEVDYSSNPDFYSCYLLRRDELFRLSQVVSGTLENEYIVDRAVSLTDSY